MVVDKCGSSVAHDDSGAGGDARAKAQALIEKIDDLRMRANDLKNAAEQERLRNNGFAENAYEAEFSRFIARDCEERATAAEEVIASLVGEHSSVMDEFADRSMWEDDGVTMCCECGELFFLKTLRGRLLFWDAGCNCSCGTAFIRMWLQRPSAESCGANVEI